MKQTEGRGEYKVTVRQDSHYRFIFVSKYTDIQNTVSVPGGQLIVYS